MSLPKKVLTKLLSRAVLAGSGKRFVFLHHDISDPGAPQHSAHYSTGVRRFREQVELLAKHFELVSLDEVVSAPAGGRRLAALTFDDGFLSVKDEALPFLAAKGIPFAVFVNRAAVEHNRLDNGPADAKAGAGYDAKVYLDADDVKELAAKGVTVGSHTASHKVLSQCGDDELAEEVGGNKQFVEGLTGRAVRHLALPYGKREHYDGRVLEFCRSAGHDYVYSTNPSYFVPAEGAAGGARLIPRISLLDESRDELLFYINRPLVKRIDI